MNNNTISVTVYLLNGGVRNILENDSPHEAIEKYLCPDERPPVQTLVIKAKTEDGKLVTLSIGQKSISARIE